MNSIDLNCDLGESFGAYSIGADTAVIPLITSANIACGFHAGDSLVMSRTVALAKEAGIGIGAHPGFPDLVGFGRRNLAASPQEVKSYIQYQVGALLAFCMAAGVPLCHVKPHGALYNMAGKDPALAAAVAEGIGSIDPKLVLLGLSGSKMEAAAKEAGLPFRSEVFADRAYRPDGSLVPRSEPDAMITDEAEAVRRVLQMATRGTVTANNGETISIKADSVCVHGDNLHALEFVKALRAALTAEGIAIRAFGA